MDTAVSVRFPSALPEPLAAEIEEREGRVESAARAEAEREERFSAFVATHRERARRMAYRLVGGDAAAADDVAQDAFIRAYRALGSFRGDSTLDTWFYRILVRQAANYRRWRNVRRIVAGPPPEDAPDPEAAAVGDPALRERIRRALDGLTAAQRDAFVLVHMEGFTAREAGELLGRAEGTVKSHLHRALRSLRRTLADLRETDLRQTEEGRT